MVEVDWSDSRSDGWLIGWLVGAVGQSGYLQGAALWGEGALMQKGRLAAAADHQNPATVATCCTRGSCCSAVAGRQATKEATPHRALHRHLQRERDLA